MMNWRYPLIAVAFLLVAAGCGKNDNFYQRPFVQAPNPYGPNNPGFPGPGQPGYPPNGGGFQPQLPPGHGGGYTPFLPVDQYMRQDPYRHQQWNQMWGGWLQHCQQFGIHPYDFQQFWYNYCPNNCGNQLPYGHFNNTYYYGMNPYMQMPYQMQPGHFWQYYQGLPLYW